jgi:hypothetical protein
MTYVNRARMLLAYMTEVETAAVLMASGMTAGDAFLTVKAAVVLMS